MNLNVLVFFLLKLCLCRATVPEENDSINYFAVESEPKEVERLAVSCAESEKISRNKKHFLPKLSFIWKKKLCDYKRDFKILFCRTILQTDYYGLEFDLENYKQISCKLKTFSVQYTPQKGLKNVQLFMFNCPNIFYIDLENNERRYLPYKYSISKGDKDDTCLVFFQKSLEKLTYPQKYISNIAYTQLVSAGQKKRKTMSPVTPQLPLYYGRGFEQALTEYMSQKQFCKPYQKFAHMFSSMNLCSLKRTHKIYICRQNLSKYFGASIILDVESFKDECVKHRMKFHILDEMNIVLKNKISVYYCPLNMQNNDKSLHYYLASSSQDGVMFFFSRNNKKGETLELRQFNFQSIKTSTVLAADIRRAKWILYPTEKKKLNVINSEKRSKVIEEELNSGKNNAQILTVIPKNDIFIEFYAAKSSSSLIDTRWLVEDFLISFSKIKKNKLAYQKFSLMHQSQNINWLQKKQIQELCKNGLSNIKYQTKILIEDIDDFDDRCRRRKITLISRECDKLETESFTLCECSIFDNDIRNKYSYYIGKSHIRNMIFIFKSYHEDIFKKYTNSAMIYPDAVLIDMNLRPNN